MFLATLLFNNAQDIPSQTTALLVVLKVSREILFKTVQLLDISLFTEISSFTRAEFTESKKVLLDSKVAMLLS